MRDGGGKPLPPVVARTPRTTVHSYLDIGMHARADVCGTHHTN